MRVGVPKEIKDNEFRVGLTPASVTELKAHGHEVLVERGAGQGSGLTDAEFETAGAQLIDTAAEIFDSADLIVKVKEPQASETRMLRRGQVLFTYLHLAPAPELTQQLIASGATCIAYETVTASSGGLPLLTPMSEVAGRLAAQVGAHYLEREAGGRGILLGGVPGVPPADVLVLGAGVAGTHAATIALGMGADVTLIDRNLDALRRASAALGPGVQTLFSTRSAIAERIRRADLVIGTVLVPGAETPKLVTREMVTAMKQGSVIIDISADQGGCCETTRPTTHSKPTYVVDGVVHYCVTNMPGAVPRTSTFALNNATLPFVLAIAAKGWKQAIADDPHLRNGLNVHAGQITCEPVARAQGLPYMPADQV
jgi:alanine dehydrogenase